MIKQLGHVCIGAYDLEATQRFYCDILGLEKTFDFYYEGELYGFYLGAGGMTFIEVFSEPAGAKPVEALQKHFCLEVEDIDAFIERVRAGGWEVDDKEMGSDRSWQTWLRDPSGIAIEVMQYTGDSSELTGRPAEVDWL